MELKTRYEIVAPSAEESPSYTRFATIGLIGYKNSGKTTLTKSIKKSNPDLRLGMIGFSNPIYEMLHVLGIPMEDFQDKSKRNEPHPALYGKSIQHAMNTLGTKWGREMIHEDLWALKALEKTEDPLQENEVYVADNVRFPNEYNAIVDRGGFNIAIFNPLVKDDGTYPEAHILALQHATPFKLYNDPRVESVETAANRLYELINKIRSASRYTRMVGEVWYWHDETGDEHGPFPSRQSATSEVIRYCETFLGEKK